MLSRHEPMEAEMSSVVVSSQRGLYALYIVRERAAEELPT
jgi:hypothetical protein